MPELPEGVVARARTFLHLIYALAAIIVALSILWQFDATRSTAQKILASGAVVALVIGLAVQGTLGNVVAGVVITFSQPIRVGDRVTIGDHTGRVARLGVSYTRIDVGDGTHIEFPNSLLADSAIHVHREPPPRHGGGGIQA